MAAALVVLIHTEFFAASPLMPFKLLAVPLFFMISGWFIIGSDGKIDSVRLRRAAVKVLKITVVANLVYLALGLVLAGIHSSGAAEAPFSGNPVGKVLRLLVVGDAIAGPLWYLTAYLQVLLILWIFVKGRVGTWIYWLIPLGLTANLLLGKYGFIHGGGYLDIACSRNALTVGLPCVLLGMWLRRHEERLPQRRQALVAVLVLSAAALVEAILLSRQVFRIWTVGQLYLLTIPLAIAVFLLCLHLDAPEWAVKAGRRYSAGIYLWHWAVALLLSELGLSALRPVEWPVVFLLTLLLVMVLEMFRRKVA